MTTLAFLDTETTGLDPDRHQIWEVALILSDEDGIEGEYRWQLPVDLARADPIALNIGGYHDRRWLDRGHTPLDDEFVAQAVIDPDDLGEWCTLFAELTRGAHLVGAVISFDEERLRRLLRANGECPMWHYHLVDVEALAAGAVVGANDARGLTEGFDARPPWDSNKLSAAVGVDPDRYDRHTALGDARWARAIYDAVLNEGTTTDA